MCPTGPFTAGERGEPSGRPVPIRLRILRGDRHREYRTEAGPHTTVLDLLESVRSGVDPSLLYRHSCHHGSCGTCACLINGTERLACITVAADAADGDGVVTVEPLRSMKPLRDLAVDPSPLFREIPGDWGYLRPSEVNPGAVPPEAVAGFVRFEDCIECGCCVSVCPVTVDFAGPASLAALDRELSKRPEREKELLDQAARPRGAPACRRALDCSRVCPTGVHPARHIGILLRRIRGR